MYIVIPYKDDILTINTLYDIKGIRVFDKHDCRRLMQEYIKDSLSLYNDYKGPFMIRENGYIKYYVVNDEIGTAHGYIIINRRKEHGYKNTDTRGIQGESVRKK